MNIVTMCRSDHAVNNQWNPANCSCSKSSMHASYKMAPVRESESQLHCSQCDNIIAAMARAMVN